jgi:hypothetical protein
MFLLITHCFASLPLDNDADENHHTGYFRHFNYTHYYNRELLKQNVMFLCHNFNWHFFQSESPVNKVIVSQIIRMRSTVAADEK